MGLTTGEQGAVQLTIDSETICRQRYARFAGVCVHARMCTVIAVKDTAGGKTERMELAIRKNSRQGAGDKRAVGSMRCVSSGSRWVHTKVECSCKHKVAKQRSVQNRDGVHMKVGSRC